MLAKLKECLCSGWTGHHDIRALCSPNSLIAVIDSLTPEQRQGILSITLSIIIIIAFL